MDGDDRDQPICLEMIDLLPTMRSNWQPLASDGNGFGLFSRFLRQIVLPLIATPAGLHKGSIL